MQNTQPLFFPPAQGGINALAGAAQGELTDALELFNMIPQEFGTAVRSGYTEHCEPVALGDGVRTILPYNSDSGTGKLFAATSDGIYDISTAAAAPVKVFDFPAKTAQAGYCSWHFYRTAAGPYLLVADAANGYIVYDGTLNSWAAGVVTGPVPPGFILDFVTVWKNRVWFVQADTGFGWYLAVGTITGAATSFNFGNKFKYGGRLVGIWNWTIDGGEGVDDYLVAISSAGDVVVYKGTDPSSATTFDQVGYYWIGKVPENNRIASDFGGELLILSSYGIMQMSKLLSGLPMTDEQISISYKVNPRINAVMDRTILQFGWELKSIPGEQLIIVGTPKEVGMEHMQFAYNTATRGWCQFIGIPYLCGETFENSFFIGTEDNQIFRYAGFSDNVLLADSGATATAIQWQMLTTYQNMGSPARFKRVQFMRPMFIGESVPSYFISARYDFDLSSLFGSPPYVNPVGNLWDVSSWDTAMWGGGLLTDQPPIGGSGMGRHVALAIRGQSSTQIIHVGTDVMLDVGGML